MYLNCNILSVKTVCICCESGRQQRVQVGVLVEQVAAVLVAQCRIPLQHKRRHPDGIAGLHRVPAAAARAQKTFQQCNMAATQAAA